MLAVLALLPILLILVLMVGFRRSAAWAGSVSLAVTIGLAATAFPITVVPASGANQAAALAGAALEALTIAATVLWIVFPALCIHELQTRSGAFTVLRDLLARLSGDSRITALLVAWFFALFIEGAAGFGTPIVIAAPILVSLGFTPLRAVTLVLIGHAAGVSFGAVGTPVFPQIALTGLTGVDIAGATALMHALLAPMLLVFLMRLAREPASGTGEKAGAVWVWAVVAAPCFLVPFYLIASFIGPELPTLGGALIGGGLFLAILRWRRAPAADPVPGAGTLPPGDLLRAALPYLILLVLILVTRLAAPLRQALQAVVWEWDLFGSFSGSIQPLYHPGTMLFLGFLLGGLLQGGGLARVGTSMASAGRRLLPVVIALVTMLCLSRIMVHAGMIATLADAAAALFGPAWPLLAPAVGVLGSFVTGSATASNILFTDFQVGTGTALGLPVLAVVAAQGFGAAVGNIVCPHNVVAGAATVGLEGREGEVLRRTLIACACYAGAGGLLLLVLIHTLYAAAG